MPSVEDFKPTSQSLYESRSLSQSVFSNPQEYLQILKKDFNQIARTDPGWMTKDDLIDYSKHGSDIKGREAARIASEHFSDFLKMSKIKAYSDYFDHKGISEYDLKMDSDLARGNWTEALAKQLYGSKSGL